MVHKSYSFFWQNKSCLFITHSDRRMLINNFPCALFLVKQESHTCLQFTSVRHSQSYKTHCPPYIALLIRLQLIRLNMKFPHQAIWSYYESMLNGGNVQEEVLFLKLLVAAGSLHRYFFVYACFIFIETLR